MRVLALAAVPIEAPATRYRLLQLVEPLARRGITLDVRPWLDSPTFATLYHRSALPRTAAGMVAALPRLASAVAAARGADAVLVQREAMLVGPPVVERLATVVGRCPLVLDLDDATFVRYVSPTYPRLGRLLKWPAKTDGLIRRAAVVTCGNAVIADHVAALGTPARRVPTVVDTDRFTPRPPPDGSGGVPVLGWIGSHSTFPYLRSLAPVLEALGRDHRFRMKVVGAGQELRVPGVDIENLPWSLPREVDDLRSFDIGLYPIDEDAWSVGKSGLKAIQYMAVGVPFVASPVGAVCQLGQAGTTHLTATTPHEWRVALDRLLADPGLRLRMGGAGRRHALAHYTLDHVSDLMAAAIREAVVGPPGTRG